ncbi:MAG: DNA adenine methylase [Clostridiales bacterium]|nr:DNA adenine methylase [Clostridiales bacterium]
MNMTVKPFVKWAGGKSRLLEYIRENFPAELGKSVSRYCEPFVGGGAVLFDILTRYSVSEVLINDINAELINTYRIIKETPKDLIADLTVMQEKFWSLDTEKRKKYYYDKRERFNCLKANGDEAANPEKAALFIFLNKTCFNGLYRVNKNGLFNVPVGAYKKPLICDLKSLNNISKLLQKVTIMCGDYKQCLDFADEKAFYYIDPPYRPLTETASFTAYTKVGFTDKEQIELGCFVDKLTTKGTRVVISNSDPKNSDINDDFFDELYSKYNISRVTAKRMINCNGDSRGNVSELLISNY